MIKGHKIETQYQFLIMSPEDLANVWPFLYQILVKYLKTIGEQFHVDKWFLFDGIQRRRIMMVNEPFCKHVVVSVTVVVLLLLLLPLLSLVLLLLLLFLLLLVMIHWINRANGVVRGLLLLGLMDQNWYLRYWKKLLCTRTNLILVEELVWHLYKRFL